MDENGCEIIYFMMTSHLQCHATKCAASVCVMSDDTIITTILSIPNHYTREILWVFWACFNRHITVASDTELRIKLIRSLVRAHIHYFIIITVPLLSQISYFDRMFCDKTVDVPVTIMHYR